MTTYQTNPTRLEAIWLDVTKRNPKAEGETFEQWLSRLGRIMSAQREADQEGPAQREPQEREPA